MNQKRTETPEQLLQRFSKRVIELNKKLVDLEPQYLEYVKIKEDLKRLEGSIQAVEYISHGKLPGDGNHDGMKDHVPSR
jgi:ribonucleotide reductase beta subunit family protein with ferritin-like domain